MTGRRYLRADRMTKTFADKVLSFNSSLSIKGSILPAGVSVLNPFHGPNAKLISSVTKKFYKKFYDDPIKRYAILGINPGRFGAGVTGVPFSDTKRLREFCGIDVTEFETHEPSSVFVYDVIRSFGGPESFYSQFYVSSLCPLGFVKDDDGHVKNCNYYDEPELLSAVTPFIVQSVQKQLRLGLYRSIAFCLGAGKNYEFFSELNSRHGFFQRVVPLDHPRFVVQYRWKRRKMYVRRYLSALDITSKMRRRENRT